MASADLRDELLCSICLNIYTDPVTLRCGHNFCRGCIDQFLNTQDGSGVYSCPECRAEFQERPVLQKNITLHNVAERFLSTHPHQEETTRICCTYCVDSPVPAVKSCLHCEASLCDKHLKVHSKEAEHVLTDPNTSLKNRKCSIHKELLRYYCTKEAICICVSCSLAGEHRGHQVIMLDQASEKKKKKLRNVLQKLVTKSEKTEERVQSLEERRRKAPKKAAGEAERVTALFIDIRRRLDDLEKRVLSEISRQEKKMSLSLSDSIQKLEIKKDELSRKMRHIEKLCNMTDPLTVLQDPDTGDLCVPEEWAGDEDTGYLFGSEKGRQDVTFPFGTSQPQFLNPHFVNHSLFGPLVWQIQDCGQARVNDENIDDLCDPELGGGDEDTGGHDGDDKGLKLISHISHTLTDIIRDVTFYVQDPVDILLDVNTAGDNILISDDLKTATQTQITQNHPETAERFQYYQVMSSRGFTSGRHYWDVETSRPVEWMVGMCYTSIDRRGDQSFIGNNNKSWSLYGKQGYNANYSVRHDSKEIQLPQQISSDRIRIYLDYEAGQLSFYELCDPIRHLHTFTATFTEPLHAAMCVSGGSITLSGGGAVVQSQHHRANYPETINLPANEGFLFGQTPYKFR